MDTLPELQKIIVEAGINWVVGVATILFSSSIIGSLYMWVKVGNHTAAIARAFKELSNKEDKKL